jgi:WD40 repeat protein
LCHSFDENSIIAGSFDRKIYIYDLRENQNKTSHILSMHHGAVVNLKVKNEILISASEDKNVFISDLRMANNPFKRLEV